MYRLINDALDSGLQPSILIFSQVKLLKDIPTQNIGKIKGKTMANKKPNMNLSKLLSYKVFVSPI